MKPLIPSQVPPHRARDLAEYEAIHQWSIESPEAYWASQLGLLDWFHAPYSILDVDLEEADFAWFSGGKLNASVNCVDRHAAERPHKVALVWAKNEPGEYEHITFRTLKHRVGKIANVLRAQGVRKGDRVCIFLPEIPELVYTMLACARIGAVHAVVYAGFSADALRERILDAGAKVVVTANEALRGSKRVPMKTVADQAVDGLSLVEKVLVVRRTEASPPMRSGRDLWLDEEMRRQRGTCPAEWMSSEDPLFILHTSGSSERPKGLLHTTAGYLLYAALTHRWVFDLREGDVHFCTADLGWITGHSYLVYGPLANGATTVLFESQTSHPDATRWARVIQDLGVTSFYTSPSVLRTLVREDAEVLQRFDRSSLRIIGSVGEPLVPELWRWCRDVLGEGRCPVLDTWWQTETGGVMITALPGLAPNEPSSATLPFFGIQPAVVDDSGEIMEGPDVRGNLCIALPWPGQARTIHGDHQRFREIYYSRFPDLYFTGDGCYRDDEGYYWITGRVDDVLTVSGHRIGPAEIERALVEHEAVAEAAVVGFPREGEGQGIFAYAVLRRDDADWPEDQLIGALKEKVRRAIGPFATPDQIRVVTALPKTRSGKVMRRILRRVVAGAGPGELGDLTTLADPSVLPQLFEVP